MKKPALSLILVAAALRAQSSHLTWSDYGGAPDSAQYSALTRINRSNVSKLRVAWTYSTGDTNKYFFNPLMAEGLVYVLAKNNSIVALDAATGKEVWVHPTGPNNTLITNRGLNYKDGRLIFAVNNQLQAIDAKTGKPIAGFGADLREGLGRDPKTIPLVQSTTPGKIFENLLILGSATNQEYDSAPGDIRAYDTRTGKLAWSFHTVPHPGEYGYDSWPKDAWKTVGGANAWGELTVDEKRGIVLFPPAARSTTSMARTAWARTSLATASSRSTPAPASVSGTSRWCTTISGITTTPPPRNCSPSNTTAE